MTQIGLDQDVPTFLVMGGLIRGKIALVNNDLELASKSLRNAKHIAEDNELVNLLYKVDEYSIESELSEWDTRTSKDLSLTDRIDRAHIQEYVAHAIKVKEKMINPGFRN
jgi:hypothetical protein